MNRWDYFGKKADLQDTLQVNRAGCVGMAATECVAQSDWSEKASHYCEYGIRRYCNV